MGLRLRAFDWSATPLGTAGHWPQGLQAVVQVMLESRSPMWLWWGGDAITLYNDAARAQLGAAHPAALGRPVREAWPEMAALVDTVRRDGVPQSWRTLAFMPLAGGGVLGADRGDDADQRRDAFLATLAHELRNPLAPLRNSLELLGRDGITREMAERARRVMSRQVAQMARLLDELLDISRIGSGTIELRRERVALHTLIDDALEIARPLIDQRGHVLEMQVPLEPVWLAIDRTRGAQVLSRLLDNAARYSEPNRRIRVTASADERGVAIAVRDEGLGIAPDVLPRIFDLFMQVEPAGDGAHGGLGVGLTLARRLVELHGGTLQAHSEGLGRGSEFVVRLPPGLRLDANAAGDAAPAAAPRRRVLVVDDNVDAAESLALLLLPEGHEVEVVHGGAQALETMQRWLPDVVLLDIGMPHMDGHEVARRIRQQFAERPILLVATTGWGQERDHDASQAAGFDHHLVKPVDPDAVLRLVASVAPGGAARDEARTIDRSRGWAAPRGASGPAPAALTAGGSRVLVADDHELVRQSLAELLGSEGHEVRTAADGLQAVEIARVWRPRYVLLDIHMPGLSGIDAARRLRAQFPPHEMTLLMLSAIDLNEAWQAQARAAGFDDCVDKTADPQGLLALLRKP